MDFTGAALAKGARNVQLYAQGAEERELRISEAKQRQARGAEQFKTGQEAAGVNLESAQQQLERQKMQTKALQQDLFKRSMFDTFNLYESGGNVRHLNTLIGEAKKNPAGQKIFQNTARADKLTNTPEHIKLLQQNGIQDAEGVINNPEVAKGYFVSTDTAGKQSLVNTAALYAGTGYTKYMTNEQLEMAQQQALITSRLKAGNSVTKTQTMTKLAKEMAVDLDIPVWEAYQRLESNSSSSGGSAKERLAKQVMEDNPDMTYLDAYEEASRLSSTGTETERAAREIATKEGREYTEVLSELRAEKQRTTGQKDLEAADTARTELDTAFDGSYFETSMADPKNRRKAQPLVNAIEKLSDKELTTEDKRVARQIRTLTALGTNAGEGISAEEAGPLDTLLRDTKSYFYDDLGGDKEAVAAYASFRNVARNALFGASLTENEIKAFNDSMGKISQQPGAIISKLKVQMQNLKADMQAIYDFNDEHVAHFYLGKGLDELDDSILAIDDRLDMLRRTDKASRSVDPSKDPNSIMVSPKPREPGAPRPALSDILGVR